MYRVTYKGQDVVFVDTPGFDSDIMTDDLTLKCISDFLMKYVHCRSDAGGLMKL